MVVEDGRGVGGVENERLGRIEDDGGTLDNGSRSESVELVSGSVDEASSLLEVDLVGREGERRLDKSGGKCGHVLGVGA